MGHDIMVTAAGGRGPSVASLYFSFNWTALKEIFSINEVHGHPGRLVARRLKQALEELERRGYTPSQNPKVDGWGNPLKEHAADPTFDVELERHCMLALHLSRFLKVAEAHPDHFWYSDQVWEVKELYGEKGVDLAVTDSDSEEDYPDAVSIEGELPPGIYGIRRGDKMEFYFRHPVRGNMPVKNYADAMEVHRVLCLQNQAEYAKSWYTLAFMLPAE